MRLSLEQIRVLDGDFVRLDIPHLEIHPGEVIVVLGANGAGKSTLLDIITGLTPPSEGRIRFNGYAGQHDADEESAHEQMTVANMAYLYQSPENSLFATSAVEEFAFTLQRPRREIADEWSAIRSTYLSPLDLGEVAPTSLPPRWSTGTKRKFAYALADATDARWFVLDEPTAGLDANARQAMLHRLQEKSAAGATIIVSTHDLDDFLPMATRVWLLAKGRVAFDGSPEEVLRAPHRLTDLGIGLSPALRLQVALKSQGWLDHASTRSPETLGAQLATMCKHAASARGQNPPYDCNHDDLVGTAEASTVDGMATGAWGTDTVITDAVEQSRADTSGASRLHAVDLRLRWLVLTALTIAISISERSIPLAVGVMATVIALGWLGAPMRRIWRLTVTWATFTALTLAIAGWQIGPPFHARAAIHLGAATNDLREMIPYWCYLQFSQLYVTGFTPFQVGTLFDRTFAAMRLPRSARRTTSVTAMLVTRFMPAIEEMYRTQVRAYRARTLGPSGGPRMGSMRTHSSYRSLFRIVHILTPFLIRLIQYGETTADAMTARRLFVRPFPTNVLPRHLFSFHDYAFAAFGAVATGAILALALTGSR